MADLTLFKQYLQLVDQLTNMASKDDLVECARLLAMNLAHYELKFGELPLDEILAALDADEPNEAQVEMLNRGMVNMVGVLGNVMRGFDEPTTH